MVISGSVGATTAVDYIDHPVLTSEVERARLAPPLIRAIIVGTIRRRHHPDWVNASREELIRRGGYLAASVGVAWGLEVPIRFIPRG
jgi:hypothetical protein